MWRYVLKIFILETKLGERKKHQLLASLMCSMCGTTLQSTEHWPELSESLTVSHQGWILGCKWLVKCYIHVTFGMYCQFSYSKLILVYIPASLVRKALSSSSKLWSGQNLRHNFYHRFINFCLNFSSGHSSQSIGKKR